MKIVATSDTHYVPTMSIPDGDVFIHAGDLMWNGYPDEWWDRVNWLAKLPHKIKLFVPGNHDFHLQVYPGPALQNLRAAGVTVVGLPGNDHYSTYTLPNGMVVLGLPYVTDLPRWAFNIDENSLNNILFGKTADIVVSHMPVQGILDWSNSKSLNVGSRAYLKRFEFLKSFNKEPKMWISGHIHEGYGTLDLSGTKFYNVCMCNREYSQVNPPMEIEV